MWLVISFRFTRRVESVVRSATEKQVQDELIMFHCDRCHYSTKYPHHLQDHQDVVHEGVIIGCPFEECSSRFTNRSNISDHVKRMHNKETFKCLECDYVAKTQRVLRVHFGLHHGVKYFACEFCDYTGGYQYVISRHVRKKHAGELTEDQRKNLSIQTCQNCGFKSDKSKIKKHVKDCFNKDRKFQCQVCKSLDLTAIFKNSLSLTYHMKEKHSSNPFTCEKCHYKTGHESRLRRHRKLHEKSSFVPRKKNRKRSLSGAPDTGNGTGIVLNHNQVRESVKTENKPTITEKVQEYYEKIKSEACDPQMEDISGEEDGTIMLKNDLNLSIKTEQHQYLCPISSCTFTTLNETGTVRLIHLKSSHGLSKDLPFLKMVL